MANEFKIASRLMLVGNQAMRLPTLASDPGTAENGDLYYNTSSNKIRQYIGGSWQDVSAGSVTLTGQALTEKHIIVGDPSNLSASVDTNATGDILATSAGGLEIKSGVIVNADVNATAAIAYSKLADLGASTNRILVASASDKVSADATILSTDLILKDGSVAFTADQSMGSFKLTNVADPTTGQDAATKAYVDSLSDGRSWKQPVKAATTANIDLGTASDPNPVDGVTLSDGDRVLLKDQTAPEENGIYDAVDATDPTTWTRSSDADTSTELNAAAVFVEQGTANHDLQFAQTTDDAVVGTDPLVWVVTSANYFSGHDMISVVGGQISVDLAAASGLESTNPGNAAGQLRVKLEASNPTLKFTGSNELAVKLDAAGAIASGASGLATQVDGSTIEISSNALRVKDAGITLAKLASNSVDENKLTTSVAGNGLSGGGGTPLSVNVDGQGLEISADSLTLELDGSTLSKSASGLKVATGGITNTEVNATAAIAYSKLAALTANRALQSDGSGFVSVSAVTSTELGYVSGVTSSIQTQLNGKANTELSNLGTTAVNADIIPDTDNTHNLGNDSTFWASIHASLSVFDSTITNNIRSNESDLSVYTLAPSSHTAKNLTLASNLGESYSSNGSQSGAVSMHSGDIGDASLETTASGAVTVKSGDNFQSTGSNDNNTGSLSLKTGDTTDGASGDITIQTGTATTTRGTVTTVASQSFEQSSTQNQSDAPGSTNYMQTKYVDSVTLAANAVTPTDLSPTQTIDASVWQSAKIDYSIKEATSNKVRTGTLLLAMDAPDDVVSMTDTYAETAVLGSVLGLSLSATSSSGIVTIQYNNTHATNAATMRASWTLMRA